jgi:flagellar basal-body rod protein FlgG
MWSAIRVVTSGTQAQERVIEVTGNNLANLQTPGFKARRVSLVDLPPGTSVFTAPASGGGATLVSEGVGQGVSVGAVLAAPSQGRLEPTGEPLDVAIDGEGFFQVQLADGRLAYTRAGALRLDNQRRLVTPAGARVAPEITLPADATSVSIAADGAVTAHLSPGSSRVLGQIQLTRFNNPDALLGLGDNLFVATDAAGAAMTGAPGSGGLGTVHQGKLEASNVDMAEEFIRIIEAQRAYQINLRALRVIDEMLQEANDLR